MKKNNKKRGRHKRDVLARKEAREHKEWVADLNLRLDEETKQDSGSLRSGGLFGDGWR